MCPLLIETIQCKNGKLYNLEFHQKRFDNTREKLFVCRNRIELSRVIRIPDEVYNGLFRCRITYAESIEKIEFIPHVFRKIESLKLITGNHINYSYKFSDRNSLAQLFDKRGACDDILIVQNGNITDSYTANVLFGDGERWFTPDTPLLPGTQRARLIADGEIEPCRITVNNLPKYKKAGLVNAMWNMQNMPEIAIGKISF